jgi:predicted MPP superfamily phosphohydrolase
MKFFKNKKQLYYLFGAIFALIILYLILAFQIPAVQKRIFVFAVWLFGEIYVWLAILSSFKNTWKKKIPFFSLLVLYWIPACVIGIAMGMLAVKGVHQLNKSLYLTLVGVCVIQYLIKFLLFIFVLIYNTFTTSTQFVYKKWNIEKGRRILLRILFGIYVVTFILMIYGMLYGADDFQLRELEINAQKIEKLPDKEYKIVLISDLHLATWRTHKPMEKAIKIVNEQHPDFIFITGDFVQFVSEEIVEYLPLLSQLKAKYGIYTVLGNHDYGRYARFKTDNDRKKDVQKLIDYQTSVGWYVLNNESIKLYADSLPLGITIAGVEFYSPKKMFINEGDLVKTFQNVDTNDYVILLSHDPQAWNEVVNKNLPANLTLSGHTHGMQLGVYSKKCKLSPASLLYKQWGGLYEKQNKLLYVNVGLGSVGFSARVGMPPEITVIRIR